MRGVAAAVGQAGSTIDAISGVEWGWHDYSGGNDSLPAAIAIDDRSGRVKEWAPASAPWAIVPARAGVLVVGTFSETAGG